MGFLGDFPMGFLRDFLQNSQWMLEMLECWVRIAKGFLVDSWGITSRFLRDS